MSLENIIKRGKTVGEYHLEMTIKKNIQEKENRRKKEVSKTLIKH